MAVQIVRVESSRLQVDIQAIAHILDKVGANPVAVIAANDPFETGKSSILNHLLCALTTLNASFHQPEAAKAQWKSSESQPNEILMWPEPFMASQNGRSTAVLLISVRGNLDGSITTMDNALIFIFACLLSSALIYHVKNEFLEDILQFMQMTVSSMKGVSQQKYCRPFAKLLFAINDWQQQLECDYGYGVHDNHRCPKRNFKKEKLDVLTGIMPEKRVVRQEILSSFQEICCLVMPHCAAETVEGFRPLQDVANWIFREGVGIKKTVRGREVTGTELKSLVQEWAGLLVISKIHAFGTEVGEPGDVLTVAAMSVALKFFRVEIVSAINGPEQLKAKQMGEVFDQKKCEAVAMLERMMTTRDEAVARKCGVILEAKIEEFRQPFLKPLPELVRVQMGTAYPERLRKCSCEGWNHIFWMICFLHVVFIVGIIVWVIQVHVRSNDKDAKPVIKKFG